MEPPFLIEADHSCLLLGWQEVPDRISYEIQMLVQEEGASGIEEREGGGCGEEQWTTLSSSLTSTQVIKKNLGISCVYRFRVRVKYAYGWDLFSESSDDFTLVKPDTMLLEPPEVIDRDFSSVSLKWPIVDGSSGYILRYRLASDPSVHWVEVNTLLLSNTVRKKGLSATEGYYFSVQPVQEGKEWGFSRSSSRCSPKVKVLHNARCGYTTDQGRKDWMTAHGITHPEDIQAISESYVADRSEQTPLYYWQLFSLLGYSRIQSMVALFYKRVYADDEAPWFRNAFSRISDIEHHIDTQTQFWVDVMGGGRFYHGGDYRLNFHHSNNADAVMNAEGARRWMYHMCLAVQDNEKMSETSFAAIDKRILPCLKDFLRTKMLKYANQHNWVFNNSDFDNFPE